MKMSPITPSVHALRCTECGLWIHPIERDCPDHPGRAVAEPVTGTGTVYSFTVNHYAYLPDIELPYVVAMIDLDPPSSLRVTARVATVDVDTVGIGTRVRAVEGTDGTRVPTFELI